ncbi:phytanoyl-CoA dioxygenase family protein [Microbispora hainanensis]|uniref:Phytanoyl-CoA dioxygenase family protein n=1 Tax=Microbispora hainanensis TaxID=568844 RepID=A0ABZ1SKH4_9ACTN|nr:phytanoyl-CoA dioxygenase family protein [Microbispora hainanensis]
MSGVSGLTDGQLANFRADGFCFPVDVLSEGEAEELARDVNRHLSRSAEIEGELGALAFGPKIHLLWPWADELIRHPALLRVAEDIVGPDILVWGTSIFTKRPGDDTDLAWHQDALTYELGGADLAAFRVWLALTPTGPENGTLRFAVGTHRQGVLPHRRFAAASQRLRGDETIFDEETVQQRDVVLRPGQASLHNMLIVHCSGVNSSDSPRLNFAVDYVAAKVRPAGGHPDSALLVRGKNVHDHFALESPPRTGMDADAVAEWRRAVRLRLRRLRTAHETNIKTGTLIQ